MSGYSIHAGRCCPSGITVTVAGEIDLVAVPTLRTCLTDAIDHPDIDSVHVDLREVTLLDCTGIGVLVTAHHAARAAATHLWLSAPRHHTAAMVWRLSGIGDL